MRQMKLIYLLFVFSFVGCDSLDEKLKIVNRSEEKLFYLVKTDTILKEDLKLSTFRNFDTTKVGIIGGEGAWEYRINKKSKDSCIYIFLFNTNKIGSNTISNNIYKRKGFKVKDLESLNWIVTYPDDFE